MKYHNSKTVNKYNKVLTGYQKTILLSLIRTKDAE